MRKRGAAVIAAVAVLGGAARAGAIPAPPPPQQAVAIVKSGVVWYDDDDVRLIGHDGRDAVLARLDKPSWSPPQISSSGTAVALDAGERLRGGVPPAPLSLLSPGSAVGKGECGDWRPQLHGILDFTVAGDELVLAGEPVCGSTGSSRQPLFVKDLRGGPWRVLRWLASSAPPILAAEGSLLAIGVQRSLSSPMDVRVLDVRDGATRARLRLPEGYLSFAAADRLVVSVPTFASFPLYPRLETSNGTYSSGGSLGGGYRLALYSLDGRSLASLGAAGEQPQISAMRHVELAYSSQTETQSVTMQGLLDGPVQRVIGFNAPGRTLISFAWRWPRLALVETTSATLPDGQFTCGYGTYAPPSAPFLQTFDLARPRPFVPAPATPPQPDWQQVLATCGPPPP